MADAETYNGWTNRETWAVALHINNDQGWQESVHEALRENASDMDYPDAYRSGSSKIDAEDAKNYAASKAGEIVRENVENLLTVDGYEDTFGSERPKALQSIAEEVGSLWRVNWTELGESFLSDLEEMG